jgi:hypothetical protein
MTAGQGQQRFEIKTILIFIAFLLFFSNGIFIYINIYLCMYAYEHK